LNAGLVQPKESHKEESHKEKAKESIADLPPKNKENIMTLEATSSVSVAAPVPPALLAATKTVPVPVVAPV
jgi:hypothetical protein